ncbi:MAG TPA: alpha/beta hydrolase [Nocardioides sp.]|nr:alpha/beta hydrolase [Nocardioides sp.]
MTTITLPDGRDLELEVTGPEAAPVLLYHHGTPGGSGQDPAMADEVHAHGHRLVTWSRAGYGASSRRPGRSVADEVDDVRAILDHLRADDCLVAGWSGGGPHALACGALAADRVRGVLCIAGVAPFDADGLTFLEGMGEENHEEFGAALEGEEALRPYLEVARPEMLEITGDQIHDQMATLIPPIDQESLTGEFGDFLAHAFRQAVSVGVTGWLDDDLAFTRPWGFDLSAISVPTYVWQGGEDLMVPFAHGQWLAAHLPNAVAHLEAGEGHLSVRVGAMGRMLDELTGS